MDRTSQQHSRLRQAVEKYKPGRPNSISVGRGVFQAGNSSEAIPWFDEALRRRADSVRRQKNWPVALIAAGQLRALPRRWKRPPRRPPRPHRPRQSGQCVSPARKLDPAAQVLQRALSVDPTRLAQQSSGHGVVAEGGRGRGGTVLSESSLGPTRLAEAHNNLANRWLRPAITPRRDIISRRRSRQSRLCGSSP